VLAASRAIAATARAGSRRRSPAAPASSGSAWAFSCRAATRARSTTRAACRARATDRVLRAARGGVVTRVDAGLLGRAATLLGAGPPAQGGPHRARRRILLHAKFGPRVARGDALATSSTTTSDRDTRPPAADRRAFASGARAPRRVAW
jgi:hypothetical protein